MYSRAFDGAQAAPAPKNYNGTLYRPPAPAPSPAPPPPPPAREAEECAQPKKSEAQAPLLLNLFDIKLNTEDLLLLGLIFLLIANNAGSDIIILLAILFIVGII